MVETKPSYSSEGNESKNLTDENKGQAPNTKNYQGNKTPTKTQGSELKAETNFKSRFSDLECYIFNIDPIASDTFSRTMKKL